VACTIMDSNSEMLSWPDGDVIPRAIQGTESREFRVHKLLLSFASPVFKDMNSLNHPVLTDRHDLDHDHRSCSSRKQNPSGCTRPLADSDLRMR